MRKIFAILSMAGVIFANPLTFNDMKTINEKIFAYHILFESYDETVAKRSLSKIFSSFDPVNFYFLKAEKDRYNDVSAKMVKEYKSGNFETYLSIRETFEHSVKRCRKYRAEIRNDIISGRIDVQSEWVKIPKSAPNSDRELKKHLTSFMIGHLRSYASTKGTYRLEQYDMIRVMDFYERKMKAHEERCISKEGFPLLVSKMIASSLDAHSMVYDHTEISNINSHLKSRYEGLGVYVADGIEGAVITGCVKSGPAERSGKIQKGDLIIHINGVDVSEMSFKKVMDLLSVKDGGQILLSISPDHL